MSVKENTYYWEYSLQHPEPDIDEEPYIHDKLIITSTDYLAKANYLRDLITTYCVLKEVDCIEPTRDVVNMQLPNADEHHESHESNCQKVLKEIDRVLKKVKNIQYTEFVAFFKCLGLSYSVYRKENDGKRLEILAKILDRYCERRKKQYDSLGYTHVTQQALYDSAASRTQGSAANERLRQLIKQVSGELIQEISDPLELAKSRLGYYVVNKEGFLQIRNKININYNYGKNNQNKIPDLVIKTRDRILIIEAKHVREAGGAQNKQVNELIQFIRQREKKSVPYVVSYVAFLDGRYFNKIANPPSEGKIRQQRDAIEKALKQYPNNYFVNTAGLCKLLTDLLSVAAEDLDYQESRE